MFNWTTTTIINTLQDINTKENLVKVWTGASTSLKSGFSGSYPVMKIKKDFLFEARYVAKVYKAYASDPTPCEITVDCSKISTKVAAEARPSHARLSFYVALEGSEESIYANDGYQKGKPFSVGFDITATDDGASIAKKIKKNAEKYGVVMYGKKSFDIGVKDAVLTIKGTHEYQRFKNAAVALDDDIDEIYVDTYEDGEKTSENKVFTLVNRGTNGFGTSLQLMKDLRLPTAHNTKWLALKEDEKVAVGAKYNQYIVTYCAPSLANPGFAVIGQHNNSVTTHVFWVNQDLDTTFKGYFKELGVEVEEVNKSDGTAINKNSDGNPTTKATADAGTKYSENHEQSKEVSPSETETASIASV